ncbi:cholinesterase-like [Saccoglossus kowalevskii]
MWSRQIWSLIFVEVFGFVLGFNLTGDPPVVSTRNGDLLGKRLTVLGKSVDAFLGVPYAAAPVGELRFQRPRPFTQSWEGVRNATMYGSSCLQEVMPRLRNFSGHVWWGSSEQRHNEDCLFLNIWAPHPRPKKTPVIVFIHGGSFVSGSGSAEGLRGHILATVEYVIVVTINYRLGVLGFATLDIDEAPGNIGLYDQTMALKWINQNIAGFGGDPDLVTIAGHSAGASSVSYHLLSPMSEHLFKFAILQSGTALSPWALSPKDDLLSQTIGLAKRTSCPSAKPGNRTSALETITCLRGDINLTPLIRHWEKNAHSSPMVDGLFLPDTPHNLLSSGRFKNTSILLGFNQDESVLNLMRFDEFSHDPITIAEHTPSLSHDTFRDRIQSLFSDFDDRQVETIAFQYRNWYRPYDPYEFRNSLANMWSDYSICCPTLDFVAYFTASKQDAYVYYFNHRNSLNAWPTWVGVPHGDELAFVLGLALEDEITSEEKDLSRRIMRYWGNFARTGNPNVPDVGGVEWPKYSTEDHLVFTLNLSVLQETPHIATDPRIPKCAFWKYLVPRLSVEKGTTERQPEITCLASSTAIMHSVHIFVILFDLSVCLFVITR